MFKLSVKEKQALKEIDISKMAAKTISRSFKFLKSKKLYYQALYTNNYQIESSQFVDSFVRIEKLGQDI